MSPEKLIPAMILIGMGLVFFFNNKAIGKGASKFYQKLYSEKNTIVMFKVAGVVLIVGGLLIIFVK